MNVTKKEVVRRLPGPLDPKRQDITELMRKLYDEDFHNLYSS
jgi:hypothetical protein